MSKRCCICGSYNKPATIRKTKRIYCRKHYNQLNHHGKIISVKNLYIDTDNYAVIDITSKKDTKVLVDKEDLIKLSSHIWSIDNRGYVFSNINKKKTYIHRFIMNPSDELVVDHINHNKLDNRRCNLRICTRLENNRNKSIQYGYSSKYKGVSWSKKDKVWVAKISLNNKSITIGSFKKECLAAVAYNKIAKKLFGEFCVLNEISCSNCTYSKCE